MLPGLGPDRAKERVESFEWSQFKSRSTWRGVGVGVGAVGVHAGGQRAVGWLAETLRRAGRSTGFYSRSTGFDMEMVLTHRAGAWAKPLRRFAPSPVSSRSPAPPHAQPTIFDPAAWAAGWSFFLRGCPLDNQALILDHLIWSLSLESIKMIK